MEEIRCPMYVLKGAGWAYCNHLCLKATPLSQIEVHCRHCKTIFRAIVNQDGEVKYFELEDDY